MIICGLIRIILIIFMESEDYFIFWEMINIRLINEYEVCVI